MYQWQKDAALKSVQDQIRLAKISGRRVSVALLAREAIRRQGITFKPDVKRLASELCSSLAQIGVENKRAKKLHADGVRRISERISP